MGLRFAKLGVNAIRSLSPGQRLSEHGITVERTTKGDIRYSINIMVDGQRIHRVVGTDRSGANLGQAEALIRTYATHARENRLSLPKGRKTQKSLAAAGEEYLDRLEREGGKNLRQKRTHFRKHLIPRLGAMPIDKINEEQLEKYREQREAEGAKSSTVNRELATLSHFFNKASSRRWKWMSRNDVPEIRKTNEPKQPFYVLEQEGLEALLKAAQEDSDKQAFPILMMMRGSTMRPSEVLKSRFEHILEHVNELYIPEAKAGDRHQPITGELAQMLRRMKRGHLEETGENSGWIFPSPRRPGVHRTTIRDMFARCVKRAKLDPGEVTPYTLRRTSITDVAETGIDLAGLMKISGHKTATCALRYCHPRAKQIAKAMTALERSRGDE